MADSKKPAEHDLSYLGIEHAQYWGGTGVFGTGWADCYTGIGSTPHEAGEDALEQAAQNGWDVEGVANHYPDKMPKEIRKQPEDGELQCYVVLYLK